MSVRSIPTTTDEMDDVIDLNQAFNNHSNSGRLTSMSTKLNHYRISLHSIDDDELKRFHRDLVTPAPSVYYEEEEDDRLQHYMFRQRPITTSTSNRPCSRTESVMLFKKINNGDEDVSFDLVSSEFRDFLDTDFMMDDILSRPVSRTTISKNASKIQDINTFRNTVYNRTSSDLLSNNNKITTTRSPLLTRKRFQDNSTTTSPSSNPRLAAAITTTTVNKGDIMPMNNSRFRPTMNNKVVYEQKKPQQHIPSHNKRLNKKRPIIANNNKTRYNNPGEENCSRNTRHHRSYSNNYVVEEEQEEAESEVHERSLEFKPRHNRIRQSVNTYERHRSDSTSSSSDDLPEELSPPLPLQLKVNKSFKYNDPDIIIQDTQRSTAAFSSSHILQHHRYSVPNTRIHYHQQQQQQQEVKKSLSSSRLIKSNSREVVEMSVTDSAKQVLACIRERRKTSSIIKMEQSPKLEGRTRFISSTLSAQQQQQQNEDFASDFRSRLQIHRGDYYQQRKSESSHNNRLYHRKYDTTTSEAFYENDGRLLISRLPQRTIYHR